MESILGILAQGTLQETIVTSGATATVLGGVLAWFMKDSRKRNDEHREDWNRVNQERREDMKSIADRYEKLADRGHQAIENNTAVMTKLESTIRARGDS
jgi:translation initiation factor 2B subunit (eIF-2B alpha/beta/delta family)